MPFKMRCPVRKPGSLILCSRFIENQSRNFSHPDFQFFFEFNGDYVVGSHAGVFADEFSFHAMNDTLFLMAWKRMYSLVGSCYWQNRKMPFIARKSLPRVMILSVPSFPKTSNDYALMLLLQMYKDIQIVINILKAWTSAVILSIINS